MVIEHALQSSREGRVVRVAGAPEGPA
jgi:hypothetical protein